MWGSASMNLRGMRRTGDTSPRISPLGVPCPQYNLPLPIPQQNLCLELDQVKVSNRSDDLATFSKGLLTYRYNCRSLSNCAL